MEQETALATRILDSAFAIHRALGPGLLESAYEAALAFEFGRQDLAYNRQEIVPIYYEGRLLEAGFRADFIVESGVLVELKSVEVLAPVHRKQVLTYLKLTGLKLGLLINFSETLLKDGIVRIINNGISHSDAAATALR